MAASYREQQLEELECVLSMFPGAEEVAVSDALRSELKASAAAGSDAVAPASASPPVRYTLRFINQCVGDDDVPSLELTYPPTYPFSAAEFSVHCSTLTRVEKEAINDELDGLATRAASAGEVVALELYQHMSAFLSTVMDSHVRRVESRCSRGDLQRQLGLSDDRSSNNNARSLVLGRRAIYFHHIIATNKRRVVMEWALELRLSGWSKIGWPGVVLVEGDELDVQEYVRRLQHLRWKQMTVRGEQTESVPSGRSIDDLRRLPRGFQELQDKGGMTALAGACRDAGVEPLFLTVMKIYGREEDDGAATTMGEDVRHGSRGRGKR